MERASLVFERVERLLEGVLASEPAGEIKELAAFVAEGEEGMLVRFLEYERLAAFRAVDGLE